MERKTFDIPKSLLMLTALLLLRYPLTATCKSINGTLLIQASTSTATTGIPTLLPLLPAACFKYRFLNEFNRARTYYNTSTVLCDTSLSGWYRFSGEAGNQMADTCVGHKHCGTDAPGWLSGDHPTVAVGPVQRKVCFRGKTNCCLRSTNISVCNCAGFYVYQLQRPPFCNSRYCGRGNGISAPSATTTVIPTVTTDTPVLTTLPASSSVMSTATTGIPTTSPEPASSPVTASTGIRTPSSTTLPSSSTSVISTATTGIPTAIPIPVCPNLKTLNEKSGVITSPFYPETYPANLTCSWQITASKGKRVKLVIEYIDIQPCVACTCDYLQIQNGSFADGSQRRERECGGSFGNITYYSNLESLKVLFVSDGSVQSSGFRATYTQLNYNVSTECSNYRFLNESNRAITYLNRSISSLCDSNLSPGWYRFSGGAGNQMAESCVSSFYQYCSTDAHGWLSGSHPVVAEGVVQRKVCFPGIFMCSCPSSSYISVRNCGAFFVYKLQPTPYCFLRYCGNGLPQAPECINYNFLNETNRARTYNKSLPSSCADTALSGWYRFSGEAGNKMANTCVNMNWCGAMYPGWLSGGHPEVADGAVQRKVCFTRSRRSCCQISIYISVRNCGRFFVYKLMPLWSCMLRYCGSGVLPPTSMTPAEPSTPTNATTIETAAPEPTPTDATTVKPTTRICSMDFRIVAADI